MIKMIKQSLSSPLDDVDCDASALDIQLEMILSSDTEGIPYNSAKPIRIV